MRLKVSSNLGLLFDLEVSSGRVTFHFVEDTLQNSVLKWVEQGITTWESHNGELAYDKFDPYNTVPIRIKVDHPLFIYYLDAYLGKQFGNFTYELIGEDGVLESIRLARH